MDFPKDEHQNLPAIEREHSRLVDEFTTNLPPPQTPSSTDRSLIIKFLNAAPLLTTFQKRGLQRFLANVGVMNDGRVVITITSILAQPKFMVLGWGSEFGACLRLLLPTAKTPTQAVFIPGDNPFEALHSNRIILCCYRLGRIHSMQEFRIDASEKACKALEQLIAMCIQDELKYLRLIDTLMTQILSERIVSV